MRKKALSISLAGAILLASCSSSTIIQSNPSGAKVYIDGEAVGITPYTHRDTKIVGTSTSVVLEKEGYAPFNTSFSRNESVDVGAIIGGLFVWVPFLWTMKYKPTHTYELVPSTAATTQVVTTEQKKSDLSKTKVEKLRELKKLLDEKVITQEEFDKEKKKVLDEAE